MLVYSLVVMLVSIPVVMYFIRKIIYISHQKHLFDEPSESRKIHIIKTPNLGGVAIFTGMMFTTCILLCFINIPFMGCASFACLLLFITGLTDDLVGMDPLKKFAAQIVSACAITGFTSFRITSLYGLFGIYEIPFALSMILSVIFIIYLVNAFNLIDGINWLAASIGLLSCIVFSFYFWQANDTAFMFLTMAMSGCLIGFMFYNKTPAKIFMGDTGSLFLGFFISIAAIHFLETYKVARASGTVLHPAPAIVLSLFIIPIYDTFRIFLIRISRGKSPFLADRNHIHHQLLGLNLSHLQTTGILLSINICCFVLAATFGSFSNEGVFLALFILMMLMTGIISSLQANHAKGHVLKSEAYVKPGFKILKANHKILKT